MLHPFTPFVTEELWGLLKKACLSKSEPFIPEEGWSDALIIAKWPDSKKEELWEQPAIENFTKATIDHTKAFRTLRTQKKLLASQKGTCVIIVNNRNKKLVENQKGYIAQLGRISDLQILDEIPDAEEYKRYASMSVPSSGSLVFLITEDIASDKDSSEKLKKDLAETKSHIERLEKLLASDFASKAPEQVVHKEREKLETYMQTAQKIQDQLK
jgi:valyl-tRNA synthetase